MKNLFYSFRQNNSGGNFRELGNGKIHLIVEALSSREANKIALENEIYFNGCDNDMDCSCCGDRWYRAEEGEGFDSITMFGGVGLELEDCLIIRK